jgi:hypothetical protein
MKRVKNGTQNDEPREETLQVRISKSERQELMKHAQLRGVTLSSLVRSFLVNGKILN